MKVIPDSGPAPLIQGTRIPIKMGISTDPEDQLLMMNVISSRIYTDKISAVLREYACNAVDANVEAGRGDTPIEVRLPSRLDQSFAVRDFGYGMTEEQVISVFCQLGKSTKRHSNELIGTLGIGSKAGFAYGDSFLVTSYNAGRKIVYNCFRNQGMPSLAEMHRGPTDAPDGVEVKVPVKLHDIGDFIGKAERIYRYFKVRPIVHGAAVIWQSREFEFAGTGWRYTGRGKSYAIMGNVGYDLDGDSMGDKIGARMQTLLSLGVEMDFEIGEIEMSASREGLEYTDHTKRAVESRLAIIATEVTKVFCDRIAKAPTLWDAHRMYGDNFEKMGRSQYGMRTLKDVVNTGLNWRGIKIDSGRFCVENIEKLPLQVVEYGKPYHGARKTTKSEDVAYVYANDKTALCINDLPSKVNSPTRIKGFFEHNPDMERLVIFTFETDLAHQKYWKARGLEGAPTINFSTVPLAASTPGSGSGPSMHRAKHSARAFTLARVAPTAPTYRRNAPRSAWWDKVMVSLKKDSGVYVEISEFEPKLPRSTYNTGIEAFHNQISGLRGCGLLIEEVHGFKHDAIERLGPGWVPLAKHLTERFEKEVVETGLLQEFADYCHAQKHEEMIDPRWKDRFEKTSQMHKLLSEIDRMRKPKGPINIMDYVHGGRAIEWLAKPQLPVPTVDLDAFDSKVRKLYPMLAHISRHDLRHAVTSFVDAIAGYVKMVGK